MDFLELFRQLRWFYQLEFVELLLVLIAAAVSFAQPNLGSRYFRAVERKLKALAGRELLSVVLVGLLALGLSAAVRFFQGIPSPQIHDEFSYLLAADTFASGRLTNPTHPFWKHFESIHIIQKPAYTSMYPAAQPLFLALGQAVGGQPWLGVWLSSGLMCAAICWMLQGWLPPSWALLGGALAIMRLGLFSFWAGSYFGGAVAALGGALVLGALPRIRRRPQVRHAIWMSLGLALLANSRPYEGMVLSLAVAGVLGVWMFRDKRRDAAVLMRKILLPLSVLLGLTFLGMGFYNWRVTGNPLKLPYQVARETYAPAQHFLWQSARPVPVYRHEVMRKFYVDWELALFNEAKSGPGLIYGAFLKIINMWLFFVGPVFTVPLFMLPWVVADRRMRLLSLIAAAMVAGVAVEVYLSAQYLAPATALFYAFVVESIRHWRVWRYRGRPVGRSIARSLVLVVAAMCVARSFAGPLGFTVKGGEPTWYSTVTRNYDREPIIQQLKEYGGRHLVIVRYAPDHNPHREWVYNRADIDASQIVWAREMDPASNAKLVRYFKGRHVWLLEPDHNPPRLTPYPGASRR